jgi:3-methyladenine DNA glycosylase/8-oxoguanine DNA glycosylase
MKTRSLAKKVEFYITPTSPFNFDGTFYNPSHFADGLTDWEPGVYWQSIRIGKHLFGLKIRDKGSLEYPKIKVSVFYDEKISPADLQSIKNEIIWRFDLNADLKEFNILMEKDKRFYPVFKKWIGMRNSSPHGLYELLIIALVLQNTTVHRTIQMLKILLETYGMALSFDNKLILVIWEPQTLIGVTEQELRNLKIGYRAKFMKHLSQDFIEGKINENELRTLDQADVKKDNEFTLK